MAPLLTYKRQLMNVYEVCYSADHYGIYALLLILSV
jgi:hypothetical protein